MQGRTKSGRIKIQRVMDAITEKPRGSIELSAIAFCSQSHANDILRVLRANDMAHIDSWRKAPHGAMIPLYGYGPGKDKAKPRPLTASEKNKRYRKNRDLDPERVMIYRVKKYAGRVRIRRDPLDVAFFGTPIPSQQKETLCPF